MDFKSEVPIYLQLRNQILLGIGRGDLRPGEHLPAVRQLAQDAGINPMTVSKAYALLKREGFLDVDRRRGAVVNPPRNKPPYLLIHLPDKYIFYNERTGEETQAVYRRLRRAAGG